MVARVECSALIFSIRPCISHWPIYCTFMYIKESKTRNKKTGKVYIKHSLVESIRTERGPRQRIVLTLGQLTIEREHWKDLANSLEAFLTGTQKLMYLAGFELPEEVLAEISRVRGATRNHVGRHRASSEDGNQSEPPVYQEVNVRSMENTDSRSLGPELVAYNTWKLLDFDNLLDGCGFSPKEQALAAAVIWGRLISPGSDISTWRWLREESSLSEFFTADISRVHKDKIYEISDKLLRFKDFLEKNLYSRQCELFPGRETLFLFDLTNFYFEGCSQKNDYAERGKSKEKRQQNPLVSLALLVDQDGFPVKSKVYKGNVGEPVTLEEVLEACGLLDNGELFKPTIAMDRGIATKGNIAFLRSHQFSYVVIERADRRHQYADEFIKRDGFETIEDSKGQKIHLKKVGDKVLCTSEARKKKEDAMSLKWVGKAEADLKKLQLSIQKGTFKKADVIENRLETIRKRYLKFNDIFEAEYCKKGEDRGLNYTIKDITEDESKLHGCYVIEFSKVEGNAEDIWRTYTTLTQVEAAFRSLKTDLGTRPVYHQGAERTEAHLFLSILAYHMLINIEHRLKANNENTRWHMVRRLLGTHQRSTLIWKNKQGEVWHKRISSSAEARHLQIYGKLQIEDPLKGVLYKA
jgi:transposase